MSVWSEASGRVETRLSSHISLEKAIRETFYGGECIINKIDSSRCGENVRHTFNIVFCYDGMSAAHKIEELIDKIQPVDYSIQSNIRW